MLPVGRQLGIQSKTVVCQQCSWEDLGNRLSNKLVWLEWIRGYLGVYCCPLCFSFDLKYKGKVLPFHSNSTASQLHTNTATPISRTEKRLKQEKEDT